MSAMLYVVHGVEIGRTWYAEARGIQLAGYFAALAAWSATHPPLGPFRTLNAAQKALERTARDEGHWPRSAA